ncbi:Golgi-associated RAB2 interactor protein 3 [Sorex fumeus]|uniref:Golgi-associated RAB2 interactor protein 3 n=1 Tax=Sorex fumeus TaxID=62283 RepID=UPI0024AD395A|nr:Golgi-associated RAB2 interactor protein 3 [Sorex fumeus]
MAGGADPLAARGAMSSSSECLLPYYTAHNYRSMGVFNTSMGDLQRQLYRGGEYDIFKYAPMFESDFIQISKKGEVIDVHNRVRMVTVGIASTSPILPLPDVMLLARPAKMCDDHLPRAHPPRPAKGRGRKSVKTLELTRLLPLKFVKISIHDRQKQQLRLKLATGRTFYLQLCPSSDAREDLFCYWEKLVYLLRPPMESCSSTPTLQTADTTTEEDKSLLVSDLQGEGDQHELKHHRTRDVRGLSSSGFAGGEGIQPTTVAAAAAGGPPSASVSSPTPNTETSLPGSLAFVGSTSGGGGGMSLATSSKAGQNNLAAAGLSSSGPGEPNAFQSITGALAMSTETTSMAVAARTSKQTQGKTSRNKGKAGTPAKEPHIKGDATVPAAAITTSSPPDTTLPPLVSTLQSEGYMSERDGSQKTPVSSTEDPKEKREKREKREKKEKEKKERSPSRKSRPHPPKSREGHHRSRSDKAKHKTSSSRRVSHRSSSHRSASTRGSRREGKDRGQGVSRRRGSSRKGHHRGSVKESGSSQKGSNSQSTEASSSTLSKKPSKISSFFKNFRATSDRAVDIMTETVEKHNIEAKLEQSAEGEGVDISSIMTSETRETIIIETKSA